MIKNLKVTAWLRSPLAGEPPALDAILEWELARRLGYKHHAKLTRNVPLSEIKRPPIPILRYNASGHDVYMCSNPILSTTLAEWTDYQNKRIDTDLIALLLDPAERKSLLVASGPYKMRHVPIRVRLIERVVWFVRGDQKEIHKLVKSVYYLGAHRNIGYGNIEKWEFEEIENDCSVYAMQHGKLVLMKTLPLGPHLSGVTGYRKGYGGAFPPYWHPETYMDIAIPC